MPQNKPVTVSDIVHQDPRSIELKKKHQNSMKITNEHVFNISHLEAKNIGLMSVYAYLNGFTETEEEKQKLSNEFLEIITQKAELIKNLCKEEDYRNSLEKEFQTVADTIVKELQNMSKHAQSAPESAPESAPDLCPCGECHGECTGHNDHTED